MKTIGQKTIETEITTCDFCGAVCQFSPDMCMTCGKHACETCWTVKMRHYAIGQTFAWSHARRFAQPCVDRLNFCLDHKPDTLEREVQIVVARTTNIERTLEKYMKFRADSVGAIQDMINYREKKFSGKAAKK